MSIAIYIKRGVRNALGVVIYIAGIAYLLNHAATIFASQEPDGPLAPMMMLLLFVVSALTTSSLVLWQPLKLLLDGKKGEAGTQLFATGASLAVCLIAVVALLAFR
jgi:hypothetical protein